MATEADHLVRCAMCRRSLLTGESARIYQDERTKGVRSVCMLCIDRAEKSGWRAMGEADRRPVLRMMHADPSIDADRLVERLQNDLERLHGQLESANGTSEQRAARSHELAGEIEGLRKRVAELERQNRDLTERLAEANDGQETLLRARRREADAVYLAGIAAEVFTRAAESRRVATVAASHGEPVVRIFPESISLPRSLRIVFGWPAGSLSFRVTCDLVARLFDVEEMTRPDVAFDPPRPELRPNAQYVGGRLTVPVATPA